MSMSGLPNPYDFANPVTDKDLFVGRDKELAEIRYYLQQVRLASRPFHLALIGDRAAGKTSFLNMIQADAEEAGMKAVRVDLDQSDVQNELAFFYKIFSSIATKAFEAGAFGGLNGRTYNTYLNIIATNEYNFDPAWMPFIFPIHYAKACAAGNSNFVVDNQIFQKDLSLISGEAGSIILLFDECTVLKNSKNILQKFRNIFMNLNKYMLVFCGTNDLFPIMDEVFSPITRQFKKIEIGPFNRLISTEKCVRKPLEKVHLPEKTIKKLMPFDVVYEIHQLSGGRPYEIQLICHMLFRRCQMGHISKYIINLTILEEIRRELAIGQQLDERPVIKAVRQLGKRVLEAINILCASRDRLPFGFLHAVEDTVHGDSRWPRDQMAEMKNHLVGLRVCDEDEGGVRFIGDQFDRIYTKYLAKQKNVDFAAWGAPVEFFVWQRFDRYLRKWNDLARMDAVMYSGEDVQDIELLYRNIIAGEFGLEDDAISDVFEHLIIHFLQKKSIEIVTVVEIRIVNSFVSQQMWYEWSGGQQNHKIEHLRDRLDAIKARATSHNWLLEYKVFNLQGIDRSTLIDSLRNSGNELFKARIAAWLGVHLHDSYVKKRDKEEAYLVGELITRLGAKLDADDMNNLGYLAISRNDLDVAEQMLRQSLESDPDELTNYNLACVLGMRGDLDGAMARFRAIASANKEEKRAAACVYRLRPGGDRAEWEEIFDVSDIAGLAKQNAGRLELEKVPAVLRN